MTRDWKNFYLDCYFHHITGTVHQWQPALLIPQITEFIYDEYNRLSITWGISTLGYVIMPEHFHLLITSISGNKVLKFLHGFRRSVSGKVRRLIESERAKPQDVFHLNEIETNAFYYKTAGKSEFRFWKEKPRVFPMNFWPDIRKKLDYIHYNPVRRGLVNLPEEWPHSSIRAHLFEERTRIIIGTVPQDVAEKTPPS